MEFPSGNRKFDEVMVILEDHIIKFLFSHTSHYIISLFHHHCTTNTTFVSVLPQCHCHSYYYIVMIATITTITKEEIDHQKIHKFTDATAESFRFGVTISLMTIF